MTDQRIALVTGAGRIGGIGFEVARQLGALGHRVVIGARQGERAAARAAELAREGIAATGVALDITQAGAIAALAADLRTQFGKLDILVNNAAVAGTYGEMASTADLTQVHLTVETILFGTWATTQALLPLLAESDHPRIVIVSSGAGSHADRAFGLGTDNAMGAGYAVAKAALNALAEKLAREQRAMRINAVCPGFTATFEGGVEMGARPVADGARGIVWAATLADDGPTGGFFRDGQPLGW